MSLPPLSSIGAAIPPASSTSSSQPDGGSPALSPPRFCVVCGTPTHESMCARCAAVRNRDSVAEEERCERLLQAARRDDEDRKARNGLTVIGSVVIVVVAGAMILKLASKPPRLEPVRTSAPPVATMPAPPVAQPPQSVSAPAPVRQPERPTRYIPQPRHAPGSVSDSTTANEEASLRLAQEKNDELINDLYRSAIATAGAVRAGRGMDSSINLPADPNHAATTTTAMLEARDHIRSLAPRGLPERQEAYQTMVGALDRAANDWATQSAADFNQQAAGPGGRPLNDPINSVRLN